MEKTRDDCMRHLALLLKTGFFRWEEGELSVFQENPEDNPIYNSGSLRCLLMEGAENQALPFVFRDEFRVCFACVKKDKAFYMFGPMSTEALGFYDLQLFYESYRVSAAIEKPLRHFSLAKVMDMTELLANLILDEEYADEELLDANHFVTEVDGEEEKEKIVFALDKEEEDEYHHTYHEERRLLDSVREGRVEDALRFNRNMDDAVGKMSKNEVEHWRKNVIVAITLCTRAAIEGGVSPADAYQISDFYIQKSDGCKDIPHLVDCRNKAVRELAGRVRKKQENRPTSNYVERCRDYVRKHYREKMYLDDIAEVLGISTSYLSRLFKKEMGVCFQDYVNQVRIEHATNLLLYSEEKIARIAEYVNFPSQSYFGKLFKEQKHMSPKKYRELYKPAEFFEAK